jgi:hypothetical protein
MTYYIATLLGLAQINRVTISNIVDFQCTDILNSMTTSSYVLIGVLYHTWY